MEYMRKIFRKLLPDIVIKKYHSIKKAHIWDENDREMLKFYSQFIAKGDICFDIGANVGNRSKIFLKLNSKVVAVEPQEDCVRDLTLAFGLDKRLTIVKKAVGESEGFLNLHVSNANSISSFSLEWIEAVKNSGRFSSYSWDKQQLVELTTLDLLIRKFGVPTFIKIDVEGFEFQVIKGLSQPVKALSFEFVPEYLNISYKCIEYLQKIGDIELNYTLGETMKLILDLWVSPQEIVNYLSAYANNPNVFGDVYVRFI